MMTGPSPTLERGRYGRTLVARLKPNEDVVESLERLCREYGIARAVVRSAVGSLVDGCLQVSEASGTVAVPGPGVEIVGLFGEIEAGEAAAQPMSALDGAGSPAIAPRRSPLMAVLSGVDSQVFAGRLVRGENLTFITVECVLQEWIAEREND
jgi:predicted DNA-binding protein with PD1-like motif